LNQKLEQENQDLKKKLNKRLSEKDEENSHLRNLNQRLLEQIKRLKDEKPENQVLSNKVDNSENEVELSHLRVHNQSLLTQIKKLKNDKKSLQNKLEQLTKKEALINKETMTEPMELEKSPDVKIQVVEKGTNTDPINITTQEDAKLVEVRISSDVTQTMEIPSISTNKLLRINKATQVSKEDLLPKVKQESTTNMVSKVHVTRMPYQHPNHKS
jgi:DNA repair exonuclease SbcCD ATPase subunit